MRIARFVLLGLTLSSAACVVFDSTGPDDADGRFPRVEGVWDIDAFARTSTCGFVEDEPFVARLFQNRDILQIVVQVAGFGELRYDGRIDRDGDFSVGHSTIFPEQAIRDQAEVDGEFSFSGRTLVATETEVISDLLTGRRCTIVWEWRGDRR